MDQPQWLTHAWALLGEREIPGSDANQEIAALFRDAGFPGIRDDETAWCAAFVGACLARAGLPGSRSLMARSYLSCGEAIDEERTGAIAVLSRGSDPALGHVGFLIGATGTHVVLLGGNQANAVSVDAFSRSRLVGLRWPVERPPQTMPPAASQGEDGIFAKALTHVLEMEGGYGDDPYDPGGPTNLGITLKVYADWTGQTIDASSRERLKQELKALPIETARAIYRARYWDPAACESLPPAIAFLHFDTAVNHGVGTAIRLLQQAAGVETDGELGPVTSAAVAAADVTDILDKIAELRRQRYRALPHFWRFGRGWLRRVDITLSRAKALLKSASAEPIPSESTTGDRSMTAPATPTPATTGPKWWGESITVWGALMTAVATVLPVVGPLIGIDITPELVQLVGTQAYAVVQAVTGLIGTVMTIYGRARATQPLERRPVSLRL